ncbi:HAT, C-terminal dimerization domain containing protein [Parasponia andersonii]|uniref:HAT, C-terminal dimerization domain containing protein n=1 Tax=Parasponia andersonii TaxID=3476 RepID=A0A2P5BU29_PARAD|nr:HAT, C-terminal dimerization domain containing protein [Parasponia andersonii]
MSNDLCIVYLVVLTISCVRWLKKMQRKLSRMSPTTSTTSSQSPPKFSSSGSSSLSFELLEASNESEANVKQLYLMQQAAKFGGGKNEVDNIDSVSTVAPESAFSQSGRNLDPFRSTLAPKIAEALICCKNWLSSSHQPVVLRQYMDEAESLQDSLQVVPEEGSTLTYESQLV